jgi:hypothetical protein
MQALISPEENNRIAEVAVQSFEVAPPLYWVACADDVTTQWTYVDGVFAPPVIPVPTASDNKATASGLLTATDWTTIADVSNPQTANPYLANQAEFIAYRNTVRNMAVYPVEGNLTWPTVPTENWVKV